MFTVLEDINIHWNNLVSFLKVYRFNLITVLFSIWYIWCSSEMKKSYSEANWSKCVTLYGQLYTLVKAISNSNCVHLLGYLKDIVMYWHKLIREKLSAYVSFIFFAIYLKNSYFLRITDNLFVENTSNCWKRWIGRS